MDNDNFEENFEQFPTKDTINDFSITMSLCVLFDTEMDRLLCRFEDYQPEYYKDGQRMKQPYYYEVSNFIEAFMNDRGWELRDFPDTVKEFCSSHPNGSYLINIKDIKTHIVVKDGKVYSPYFWGADEVYSEEVLYYYYNEGLYVAKKLYEEYCRVPKDEDGNLLEEWNEFVIGTDKQRVVGYFKQKYHFDTEEQKYNYNIFRNE